MAVNGSDALQRAIVDAPVVLWIDDDLHGTAGTVDLLSRNGFRVDMAPSATAGISLARQNKYSLILLDLLLPDLPGIGTLRAIRNLGIDTPIVIVTEVGTVETAVMLMRMGARDIIQKPVIGEELITAIREHGAAVKGAEALARVDPTESREICMQIARAVLSRPRISLPQAAQVVGVSRHAVERSVRAETGRSFREWRRALMMQRAADVLRCSTLPVKAVAYEFGYDSVGAFARAFRRVLGMSPEHYRQRWTPSGCLGGRARRTAVQPPRLPTRI